jgi:hypothetical protein
VRWMRRQLDRVAASTWPWAWWGLPAGLDPHVEAPEAVASLAHHWLTDLAPKVLPSAHDAIPAIGS